MKRHHQRLTVGIDVGGTSLRASVVDADGQVLDSTAAPTPHTARALERGLDRAVQELAGNLLGVRPIVTFEEGELRAVRRVRAEQATQDILGRLRDRFGSAPVRVAVGLAGRDPYRLHELREEMKASGLNIRAGRTQLIGSVIGAHTGPGMVAFVAEPMDV